jgi:hypothetical protein
MSEYVTRLEELDPDWRSDSVKGSGWVSVSTLGKSDDPEIAPELKTAFDWVKESNLEKVSQCLKTLKGTDILFDIY